MATTTQNYSLKKFEVTDLISVDPFNENFDKIDEKMKANADAASAAQGTANSAVTAASNAQSTANSAVTAASNAQNTANGKITNAGGVSSARVLTQAEYNALSTKDSNTIYFIKG